MSVKDPSLDPSTAEEPFDQTSVPGQIIVTDVARPRVERPDKPAWRPTALHSERIHPAHLAATFANVEELFAPSNAPDDIEYGAQPPG